MSGGTTAWLNDAGDDRAAGLLREVCASRAWARAVLTARPYPDLAALLAASDLATAELVGADLDEAFAGHPPIGRPRPGDPVSAAEQGGVADAQRAEFLRLNEEYRQRFGHVFLICATGRGGEEMLAALRERLGNPAEREREIARAELGRINRLRLVRLAARQEAAQQEGAR
ncbi:2-oxo-4-hydroxy-4-carboxy-5-ureidoimidazoline decarboxylase [Wenjunlia vitaminophila]|uniref:2-oxo-4-hydroxy-4-carboxy-5-ureidoimidazoline decarboxylase n=1 Tax=Wenjunlia vitaminophila TaxID=76728 RepID=UPI00036A3ACD|nr:2-oxo-4-hydroxy-4-carboxy-5-ureidoimidazoline decarboxylase [Wenjunlia vitaminophila]